MPTPHIEAKKGSISDIVIMPGDPKRVEFIKDNYLTDAEVINEVRGELGVTGYYKGRRITVFSSGMGIPSMGIYSHELFTEYEVKTIIRIGSAGSYIEDLKVKDLFLATSAFSTSNYAVSYTGSSESIVYSDKELNSLIESVAKEKGINLQSGTCHSTDSFYTETLDFNKLKEEEGCKCVEMESFSLFLNASVLGKKATSLLTISDSFVSKDILSSEEREKGFTSMIELALEVASRL